MGVHYSPEDQTIHFTAQKCLLSSLADQVIYQMIQISCVLLTVALLFVLTLFLVMGMFVMDMICHVGRAVVDTGVHTASTVFMPHPLYR